MLYFLANMLSKTCPSSVQALSKPVQTPHFYVQAWEIRLQKYCNLQHGLVQAFRPTGLFIILNIKRTDDSHSGASKPQAPGRHARISPFLEFYLRLLRFWFFTHSKSRQQPSPHCFREGKVLPGFGNRTPASTLNFLLWLMILSIIVFITITMITVYFFVYFSVNKVSLQMFTRDYMDKNASDRHPYTNSAQGHDTTTAIKPKSCLKKRVLPLCIAK